MNTKKTNDKPYILTGFGRFLSFTIGMLIVEIELIIFLHFHEFGHTTYKTIAIEYGANISIPFGWLFIVVTKGKIYFHKYQSLIINSNGININQPTFDDINDSISLDWINIKHITFSEVKSDNKKIDRKYLMTVTPKFGKKIYFDFSHYLFTFNIYHMAKAIKRFSQNDNIINTEKPLWYWQYSSLFNYVK